MRLRKVQLPSLKLTAKAPEALGLEDEEILLGRPPARCYGSFRECRISWGAVTPKR